VESTKTILDTSGAVRSN